MSCCRSIRLDATPPTSAVLDAAAPRVALDASPPRETLAICFFGEALVPVVLGQLDFENPDQSAWFPQV